jgi:hypothetical protein
MRILIALLLVIPAIVFGQEQVKKKPRPFEDGYVIYADDRRTEDALVQVAEKQRGLVKFNFRKSYSGVIREIRAEQAEIVGFGLDNGAVYHAVGYTHDSIPGRFFVKVLVDGNLSLYDDYDALIIKLMNGTTFELTSANYRNLLQTATVACPAVNQMAQYLRFDAEVLMDYIKGYNKCLTKDPAIFDPFKKAKKIIYVGISAGIEFTTLNVAGLAPYPPYSIGDKEHIFGGLLVYIPFAKSQALELGIVYKPREFEGSVHEAAPVGWSGTRTHHITVNYDEIMFPITFRQALWKKNKTTYHGSAGVSIPLLVSQASQITIADTYNSNTYYTLTKSVTLSKSIQYNIGIGVEIPVKNRRLLIQNIFFFGPASMTTSEGSPDTSIMGYSLFIGYTLW